MIKIALGFDIGTQFCYAGYFVKDKSANYKFMPAFDKINIKFGIPSTVAVSVGADGRSITTYLAGKDADDYVKEGKAYKTTNSVKELIQYKIYDYDHVNFKDFAGNVPENIEATSKHKLFNALLTYMADKIKTQLYSSYKNDYQIVAINFACPNIKKRNQGNFDGEEYKDLIKKELAEVFTVFGNNIANDVHYNVHFEGDLGGLLASKFYSGYDKIITVDIGAGTSDFAIIQPRQNLIDVSTSYSVLFGGLDFDAFFLNEAAKAGVNLFDQTAGLMCEYKKWLFDSGDLDDNINIEYVKNRLSDRKQAINEKLHNLRNYNFDNDIFNEARKIKYGWNDFCDKLDWIVKQCNHSDKILVLLLGGTSRIPFIKQTILGKFKERDIKIKLEYLADNKDAKAAGITDANFISYAAAFPEKLLNETISVRGGGITMRRDHALVYHKVITMRPCQPIAVLCKDLKNKYCYCIIANAPNGEAKQYFLSQIPLHDIYRSSKELPPTFSPTENVYQLSVDSSLPRDTMQLIPISSVPMKDSGELIGEFECYDANNNSLGQVKVTSIEVYTNFKGQTDEVDQFPNGLEESMRDAKNVIDWLYGTCYNYDFSIGRWNGALQLAIYNEGNKQAYYGNDDTVDDLLKSYYELEKYLKIRQGD